MKNIITWFFGKRTVGTYLSGKLHRIRTTHADVDYIGSVAIDKDFMDAAGLEDNEQVHIVNLENGERWVTYVIPAPRGSKMMSLNGGGAFLGKPGDKLVVMAYRTSRVALVPKVAFFDEGNVLLRVGTTEGPQAYSPDMHPATQMV